MLHGTETWGPNVSDLQRLQRIDSSRIRWICGVKPGVYDSGALVDKLYLCDIINVLRSRRTRCFGPVERPPSASCIKMASDMKISSLKRSGRPRKTWLDCVKNDIKECCPTHTDPQDCIFWRAAVGQCLVLPTPSVVYE